MHVTVPTPKTAGLLIVVISSALLTGCSGQSSKSASTSSPLIAGGTERAAATAAPAAGAGAYGVAGNDKAPAANGVVANGVAANGGAAVAAPAANGASAISGSAALQSRDIVRTATLNVTVADVTKAANSLTSTVTKLGGRVDQDNRTASGSPTAELVLRLVPSRLDQAMAAVASLGHETSQTVSGQDVTASVADVGARVGALQTSVRRLQALLGSSANLPDLISLESQLTQRQASLDSTVAQQRALSDQVTLASLTVNLSTPVAKLAAVKKTHPRVTGFGSALSGGGHAAAVTARILLAGVGYSLPFLVIVALLGGVAWWLRRLRLRRHLGRGSDAQPDPS